MKLGLISDIHGDIYRLKQALEILQRQSVDQIICAGDVVFGIARADEVIDLLQRNQIQCVRGNHDRWYFEYDIQRNLSDPTSKFLTKLPKTLELNFQGVHLLLVHGTPWNDSEIVTTETLTIQKERFFRDYAPYYDVIVCGHTHIPMHLKLGNLSIVNPGSICRTYGTDSATCATLTLPDLVFTVHQLKDGSTLAVRLHTA